MTVSVFAAAKRMGKKSDWSLSNLKIQKMLYIAHMFHLGRHKTPLVDGYFEAWDYGPVHPNLYHRLKIFGASPVTNIFRRDGNVPDDGTEADLIDETVTALADAPPGVLVGITHLKDGAWSKNYVSGARGIRIQNEDILEEYKNW